MYPQKSWSPTSTMSKLDHVPLMLDGVEGVPFIELLDNDVLTCNVSEFALAISPLAKGSDIARSELIHVVCDECL